MEQGDQRFGFDEAGRMRSQISLTGRKHWLIVRSLFKFDFCARDGRFVAQPQNQPMGNKSVLPWCYTLFQL
jgi:hypothetical protein